MTAEAPTKPDRETWRDWQPDPDEEQPMYTREQLISRLQRRGYDVTANNIRHWQAVGAIPAPTRQWYGSAVHALYPEWLFNLIPYLIRYRQDGLPWPEIRERLRAMVPELIARSAGITATVTTQPQPTATVTIHPQPPELNALDEAVRNFAAHHEDVTGTPIARAELRLFDAEGRQRGRRVYNTDRPTSAKT